MDINNLVIEKVNKVILSDPNTGDVQVKLDSVEDGNLATGATGTAVNDADGTPVMTLYNAATASLSGTASFFSMDLFAAQMGSDKEIASESATILTQKEQTFTVTENTFELAEAPVTGSLKVYKTVSGNLGEKLELSATAGAGKFTLSDKTVTLPDGEKGQFWVMYDCESQNAVKVAKRSDKYPGVYVVTAFIVARDICNKNDIYTGVVRAARGEINPESIEIGLNSEGKHSFEINFNKNYCGGEADLFTFVVDK